MFRLSSDTILFRGGSTVMDTFIVLLVAGNGINDFVNEQNKSRRSILHYAVHNTYFTVRFLEHIVCSVLFWL